MDEISCWYISKELLNKQSSHEKQAKQASSNNKSTTIKNISLVSIKKISWVRIANELNTWKASTSAKKEEKQTRRLNPEGSRLSRGAKNATKTLSSNSQLSFHIEGTRPQTAPAASASTITHDTHAQSSYSLFWIHQNSQTPFASESEPTKRFRCTLSNWKLQIQKKSKLVQQYEPNQDTNLGHSKSNSRCVRKLTND